MLVDVAPEHVEGWAEELPFMSFSRFFFQFSKKSSKTSRNVSLPSSSP